jgi:hypothetical protein
MRHWIVSLLLLPNLAWAATPQATKTHKPAAPIKQVAKVQPKYKWKKPAAVAVVPMVASVVAVDKDREMLADQVHTGRMVCELGQVVDVSPEPQSSTAFVVQLGRYTYHMQPVVSSTGAIRLEDAQAGAMWLQLSNKSMLMNSKLGQRMADECQSPAQMAVAQAMKLAPQASLLDDDISNVAKK